eukprot:TRINITY_DN11722_c0_g2_i1.p1 TRINITY_DN11722_c0_g2~~TRINITY_DN11722_c0_g2_i1.p1  ORF type:complete len:1131 (-),score=238.54 TRINITY_DN11722_c0_g2_i1:158-3550(-)
MTGHEHDHEAEDLAYLDEEEQTEMAIICDEDGEGGSAEEEGEATGEVIEVGSIMEVQDQTFEEIKLPEDMVEEVQRAWQMFINQTSSREAAGEAIYAALFDSAPTLQSLFKTPRAVMAMRFINGLNTIINSMSNPSELKIIIETLGFQHLERDVTVPRVAIFRDAICELFEMDLGARFSSRAKAGLFSLLNYVGGAFIYVRREYSGRLRIIATSWRVATGKEEELEDEQNGGNDEQQGQVHAGQKEDADQPEKEKEKEKEKEATNNNLKASTEKCRQSKSAEVGSGKHSGMTIPKTFDEMFLFNSVVMGYGQDFWMKEVLEAFDGIVSNVSNSSRLQEACDSLSLSLGKYRGTINLPQFKAIMLASLRSLVPSAWDSDHEVAWTWLWENVERMLRNELGKPVVREKALGNLILSFDEESLNYLRREVYTRFFEAAPAGQDHFKQSTTRLYWIADRIVEMTIEMYRDPKKLNTEISALGLRHVGYAIPTEFFAPFVSAAVSVVRSMTSDEAAEDAFRWSLSLIGRILVRTVNEGSTVVMQAINSNDGKSLAKAVSCAPRGKRASWVLKITVGTESISPLYWAITSGSLESAKAMIKDLLIIRADRDNYYYGADELFERHPEVIHRLTADAPLLLPTLLDGLIWRSRLTTNGERRVNYYVKNLIQTPEGDFSQALEWLVESKDPKMICHPCVVLFSELLWSKLASRQFFLHRLYFLFTLCVFLVSQSLLRPIPDGDDDHTFAVRATIFACRCFIYCGSMGQMLYFHIRDTAADLRSRSFFSFGPLKLPEYLQNWKDSTSLLLTLCLLLMLTQEPIFYCISSSDGSTDRRLAGTTSTTSYGLFTQQCSEADSHRDAYADLSMIAMLVYWVLLIDLSIFSTQIAAFVLVCGKVLSEVLLFLVVLAFLIVAFASAISALNHKSKDFANIPRGMFSLGGMALNMYPQSSFSSLETEVALLVVVMIFIVISTIFLLNLLVAQLFGAYQAVYGDMVGFARLDRGKIVVETMASIATHRWNNFLASLKLDERLEFNEGDVGLAGGIQVVEPANANPTTMEAIRRFGGSTSPFQPWPAERIEGGNDQEERLARLEKSLSKAVKKLESVMKKSGASGSSMAGGSSMTGGSSSGGSSTGGSV